MSSIRGLVLLGGLLLSALAQSQVLYGTGFEPPTYPAGPWAKPDGWTGAATGFTVQSTTVFGGTQALQGEATGQPSGSTILSHAAAFTATSTTSLVRASANFRIASGGTSTTWVALSVGGPNLLCQLVAGNAGFRLGLAASTVGSIPIVRDVWHQVQIDVDFVGNTCAAWIDGAVLGQGAIAEGARLSTVAVGINAAPGTDKAYWDDILVKVIVPSTQVVEFYNSVLDNFFITGNAVEQAAIDGGSAGPGWSRTGNSFTAGGTNPVCRFYGSLSPGPNSHFYTADTAECQGLKALQASTPATQKRWNFESNDFVTTATANSGCADGLTPVYRAYNNGLARGIDSNHRITSSLHSILSVGNRGWVNEGVVMCAP